MELSGLIPLIIVLSLIGRAINRGGRRTGTRSSRLGLVVALVFFGIAFLPALIMSSGSERTSVVVGLLVIAGFWAIIIRVIVAAVRKARQAREAGDLTGLRLPQPARPPTTRRPPDWAEQLKTMRTPSASRSPVPPSATPTPAPAETRFSTIVPTPEPRMPQGPAATKRPEPSTYRPAPARSTSSTTRPPRRRRTASDELVERARESLRRDRSRSSGS